MAQGRKRVGKVNRDIVYQVALLLVIGAVLYLVAATTQENLARLGVDSGIDFLWKRAGFEIGQKLIPYNANSTIAHAFVVALLNTLLLAAVSIICASILGVIIGLARLSDNWMVSRLATAYIEIFRNIPALLQIFFWYFVVLRTLPRSSESIDLFNCIFLNNRGLFLPTVSFGQGWAWIAAAVFFAWALARISHQLMRPRLSFLRQRARAPSTRQICREQIWTSEGRPQGAPQGWVASTTAMLSVAGTRWRKKFGAIIASTGEKCGLVYFLRRQEQQQDLAPGRTRPETARVNLATSRNLLILAGIVGVVVLFDGLELHVPRETRFGYRGGIVMMPEFLSLVVGLSMYNATYIGEIVRSGFTSISRGQVEAADSLGLTRYLTIRLILFPQALRVIIPPLTTVYLNLFKSTSLAAAIAYPELVSVFVGTVNNLVGQPVFIMAITMAVYVFVSLCLSLFLNWYNRKIALTGVS